MNMDMQMCHSRLGIGSEVATGHMKILVLVT